MVYVICWYPALSPSLCSFIHLLNCCCWEIIQLNTLIRWDFPPYNFLYSDMIFLSTLVSPFPTLNNYSTAHWFSHIHWSNISSETRLYFDGTYYLSKRFKFQTISLVFKGKVQKSSMEYNSGSTVFTLSLNSENMVTSSGVVLSWHRLMKRWIFSAERWSVSSCFCEILKRTIHL